MNERWKMHGLLPHSLLRGHGGRMLMPKCRLTWLTVLLCQVVGAKAGIAGFHKWFSGAFPSAVIDAFPKQQELYDHVCIDMNQVLHVALRKARDENHAMRRIFRDVNHTLRRCAPRQSVVFAFDGSAPLAKLIVQRSRRENIKRNAQYSMSSLHLSPGTEFMEKVASAMEYYAFQESQKPCYRGVTFYVSGASVPGEGELKCIDWIKHMCQKGTEESAVIVGGDADLVLQGLALPQVKNMFIFSPGDRGAARLASIWEVVRSLEKLFPGQSEFVRADLMVLVMLNGNDYLPKVRGVSFRRCFRSYVRLKGGKHRDNFLIDGEGRTFCWNFLSDLLADMVGDGDVQAASKMDKNSRYPPAAAMLNLAVQQGKLGEGVELQIHKFPESAEDVGGGGGGGGEGEGDETQQWRSSTTVRGHEYTWIHTTSKKKTAKHEAAAMLLEELLPDVYEKYLEQETARLLEESGGNEDDEDIDLLDLAEDDEETESWQREDQNYRRSKGWSNKEKSLFNVEDYLTGILWNLQMYVDGYTPNFYWRYSLPYGPSCSDVVSWIKENPGIIAKMRPPVSSAPPLPAAVACLCMMPMTKDGRDFLPKRLQPLVEPGSPLREALEWTGVKAGLYIPKILRVMQQEAPLELVKFRDGTHNSHAWKVVYLDSTSPPRKSLPPRSPTKDFAPLEETNHINKLQRVQTTSMAATSAPRCLPWSNPGDPTTWQQHQGVQDQPYKKAFSRGEGGGASRGGRGGRGRGGGAPKSVAWRKDTSAPGIRHGGGRGKGRGRGGRGGGRGGGAGDFVPAYPPRRAPAGAKVKARVSPPVARHSPPGSSMCFGGAAGRPQCRVRL